MYNLCFNNISVILGWSNSFVNKTRALIKPGYREKTTGLPQVSGKLYRIVLYT